MTVNVRRNLEYRTSSTVKHVSPESDSKSILMALLENIILRTTASTNIWLHKTGIAGAMYGGRYLLQVLPVVPGIQVRRT